MQFSIATQRYHSSWKGCRTGLNTELIIMEKVYKHLLLLLILYISTNPVLSQVSFAVDSLFVSDAIWLCQNDVVITHFAYGPIFDMKFSIKNDSNYTLYMSRESIHVYLKYNYLGIQWRKKPDIDFENAGPIVVFTQTQPDTSVGISSLLWMVKQQRE